MKPCAILLLLSSCLWLHGQESDKKYTWPLTIRDGISSTFQEFRSSHFHSGIDLRTYQRSGFPVLAIADGFIEKISVSNRNYGRCLVLRHADGKSSLYGHLDKFSDAVEAIVSRVRTIRGEKYFSNYVLPEQRAVRQGEVIASSGESGAGFCHLHLEIRDAAERMLNPLGLLSGALADGNEPRLKGILLRSRGGSLVNGDVGEFYFKLRKNGAVYTLAEPLTVTGSFDITLDTFDLSDVRHVIAPYSVEAWLDGQLVFLTAFDSLTYDDNNQLGMLYDMAYSTPGNYFINLCSQKGFVLEKSGKFLADLLQQIPPGLHEIAIVVKDQQQNQARAVIPLRKVGALENPVVTKHGSPGEPGNGLLQRTEFSLFVNHDDLVVKIKDLAVPAVLLKLHVSQGGREQVVLAHEYKDGAYFCFKLLGHDMRVPLRLELSNGRQTVEVKQTTLQVIYLKSNFAQTVCCRDFLAAFGPTSVLEPKVLLLESMALGSGFPILAGPTRVEPAHFAFLDAVFFKFKIPPGEGRQQQLGIFKYRPALKTWRYITTRPDMEPGIVSCRVLTGGIFALLRDNVPPFISFSKPRTRSLEKLDRLVIHLGDKGKGIDDETIAIFLNGRKIDGEYDPDWSHIILENLPGLKSGINDLLVRVSDLAGNLSEKKLSFFLK
jgi:hypothetical protein